MLLQLKYIYNGKIHDKSVIVPAERVHNIIGFACESGYTDCLIHELCIGNSLGNLRYVSCSFEITTKDEELGLRSIYIGYLNDTGVLVNGIILLGLPNAPRNLFPNY
jgi:hypothetical protein